MRGRRWQVVRMRGPCKGAALCRASRLERKGRWLLGAQGNLATCRQVEARFRQLRLAVGCRRGQGAHRCRSMVCSRRRQHRPHKPRGRSSSSINTQWPPRKCTGRQCNTLDMLTRSTTTQQPRVHM